jgi:hypothetical protein
MKEIYGVTWNELVLPGTERHQGQRKELSRNPKRKAVGGILRLTYLDFLSLPLKFTALQRDLKREVSLYIV